ncbi:MAG: hypothetical protein KBB32_10795 [Spirochaetia bacterium]|nr:hypothetical protein [Spirochaetia bacterium]
MRKLCLAVALVLIAAGALYAQGADGGQGPVYYNDLGMNFVAQFAGMLSEPMIIALEGNYQHSFGKMGLDIGLGYSKVMDYDISAFSVMAGPALFFGGNGVDGLWLRARAGFISVNDAGLSSFGFGADAHLGYNLVLKSMVMPWVIAPFAGIVYAGQASFQWGISMGGVF